jgi:hypothetical protein
MYFEKLTFSVPKEGTMTELMLQCHSCISLALDEESDERYAPTA